MTEAEGFGRFRSAGVVCWAVGLMGLSACAVAGTIPPGGAGDSHSISVHKSAFYGEATTPQVVAGAITLLRVHFPGQASSQEKDRQNRMVLGEFEGIELPFFPTDSSKGDEVYEAILGIPWDRKTGPGTVFVHQEGAPETAQLEIPLKIIAGKYPSERLSVDGSRVLPRGKKILERIKNEQAEIGEIYRRVTLKKYWSKPFELPIQSSVTSQFGTRRLYNGKLKNFHQGLDLKANEGTPVVASAAGVVVMAKELFYTGNTIMVDHGYGMVTVYAHLSKMNVKMGDVIDHHQQIGLSGKTGRVSGPHLHWQAVVHKVKVNPASLTQVIR